MSDLFDADFSWSEPTRSADHARVVTVENAPPAPASPRNIALPQERIVAQPAAPKQADPVTVATVATVAGWREGVAALHALPCPGWLSERRWRQLNHDADWFAMAWGDDAFRLGWTVPEVFGCYRQPWCGRVDHDGLVILLRGRGVSELSATSATIEDTRHVCQTFLRRPRAPAGALIWEAFAQEITCLQHL